MARFTFVEIASQAVGLAIMVVWAYFDRSIWALAAGGVTVGLSKLTCSFLLIPGKPNRITWDAGCASELFNYGKWIFLSTALTFFATQSDKLIFGKLVALDLLGVYSIAAMLAALPQIALSQLGQGVIFPFLSRIGGSGDKFVTAYYCIRFSILFVGGFIVSILISFGDIIVELLYDPRYLSAGWMLQILSISIWFGVMELSNGSCLLAIGKPKWIAYGMALKLLAMIFLIAIGFIFYGFKGAIIGYALSECFKYLVSAYALIRHGYPTLRQDFLFSLLLAVSCSLVMTLLVKLRDFHSFVELLGGLFFLLLFWLPTGVLSYTKLRDLEI